MNYRTPTEDERYEAMREAANDAYAADHTAHLNDASDRGPEAFETGAYYGCDDCHAALVAEGEHDAYGCSWCGNDDPGPQDPDPLPSLPNLPTFGTLPSARILSGEGWAHGAGSTERRQRLAYATAATVALVGSVACVWCRLPVDPTDPTVDVDRAVPGADGGRYVPGNVLLAHSACNTLRNEVAAPREAWVRATLPTVSPTRVPSGAAAARWVREASGARWATVRRVTLARWAALAD